MSTPQGICARLWMSDLDKSALEKDEGKTAVVIYVVPRSGLPYGATHAVYQAIPGRKGEEHPRVGHAKFYPDAVPAELQTDLPL